MEAVKSAMKTLSANIETRLGVDFIDGDKNVSDWSACTQGMTKWRYEVRGTDGSIVYASRIFARCLVFCVRACVYILLVIFFVGGASLFYRPL